MKKKPEIFKPVVENIKNNKKTYCSFLEDKIKTNQNIEIKEDPIDFLNRIENDGNYIFSKKVIIETKDNIYNTKIAGKIGNEIVTIDNKSININEIIKIYEKNN